MFIRLMAKEEKGNVILLLNICLPKELVVACSLELAWLQHPGKTAQL